MLESVRSFGGWGASLTRPVLESVWLFVRLLVKFWNLSDGLAGGEFLLHAPCWNQSDRSEDGEFLLHAKCWNVSGRSSGGESLLHALCWNLSSRSVRDGRL